MSQFGKRSLFSYLLNNVQKENIDNRRDVNVSSPSALALLTALSFDERPRKMFFLFPSVYEAEEFTQILGDYLSSEDVYLFSYDEILRSSAIGVSPETALERESAIASVFDPKPSIFVAHGSSSLLRICPKERYQSGIQTIQKGDMLDKESLIKKLSSLGYSYIDRVTNRNQFASRGEILDVYDAYYSDPVRIQFFGDEIDDIRFFKVQKELSYEHIDSIQIHPASLLLLSEDEVKNGFERMDEEGKEILAKTKDRRSYEDLIQRLDDIKQQAISLNLKDVQNRFYPLFSKDDISLLDYLDGYEKYLYHPEETHSSISSVKNKEKDYFESAYQQSLSLKEESVYINHKVKFEDFSSVVSNSDDKDAFIVRDNSYKSISYSQSNQMIEQYLREGYKIRIALPEPNLTNYVNYLNSMSVPHTLYPTHSPVMLYEGRITHGFELPKEKHVYLSSKEIYGVSDQKSRFLSRYKEAKIIRRYEDLQVGDYVVHEIHGVGKYLGVDTIDGLEYLKIEYADNAVFYLPLNQYRMIRKYSARDGYSPSLDKLGGSTWSRKKSRIRSRMAFLADQLLAIYAERKTRPGFAFLKEPEMEFDFRKTFPYPYTDCQLKVIQEVFDDMEKPAPMDRLIAGDVGFGKTEIAFNAAFKAILSHKQVAFLCPTTILSMQHYKNAVSRFAPYGVRICAFNRFIPKKEQEKNIQLIKNGEMDLIIGTHRLLSDDIVFKDLGLYIVDEEQKFGVTHKEKIKEKVKNVDSLTLTATPIPRTLQMSLLNVRSLSLLDEAPINRMPVKTYVLKYDKEVVYEVIQKELDRKGQVYYLHNDIKSIFTLANSIQKHFPNHKVAVVHAQMAEDEIEKVMDDFYDCTADILVCTSIIESGLDIPNVNTILVDNADHFGLSQLYQIKGRVGRSDRLAYAYFFFRDSDKLTDTARLRLKALKNFTELGSGYKIAMQDLNIRGAGDILGSEQAGFVDSLGYDAYIDLLNQVVKEKSFANTAVDDKSKNFFELSFSLDAHIPDDYGNESQRISMYRELSDCKSYKDINEFGRKLNDVYGPYPAEVGNLLLKRGIELNLNCGIFESFEEGLGIYILKTTSAFSSKSGIYKDIQEIVQPLDVKVKVKIADNKFGFSLTKTKDYLQNLLYLTQSLRKLSEKK